MSELRPTENPRETGSRRRQFDELRCRGWSLTCSGEFEAALGAYLEARSVAGQIRDQELVDGADLNVAMVRLQMGQAKEGEEGLRQILLRTSSARVSFLAAYHLASSLRKQGRHERALSYAQRAFDKARELDSADALAKTHNLRGNILLNQNYLEEAHVEYREALRIRDAQTEDTRYSRAILLENLGYCLLLKGQIGDGLSLLEQALLRAREVGDRRCEAECLQDLCYGRLLDRRHREAIGAGESALQLAFAAGYDDIVENCHYLLGELGTRTGNLYYRDEHFEALQALHPELPFLKDFLCAVDVTRIITLKR